MNKLFVYLLTPYDPACSSITRNSILTLLVLSMACIAIAPLLMPQSYSWLANTISESGAQGIKHAWLARTGFLCFGLAVVWLAFSLRGIWAQGAVLFHLCFGINMLAVAAFSIQPWEGISTSPVSFDPIEDFLHNLTSTIMGFGFALGVVIVLLQRNRQQLADKLFDAFAIGAATFIPIAMLVWTDIDGLVQRLMFFISYLWYAKEALRISIVSGMKRSPTGGIMS